MSGEQAEKLRIAITGEAVGEVVGSVAVDAGFRFQPVQVGSHGFRHKLVHGV